MMINAACPFSNWREGNKQQQQRQKRNGQPLAPVDVHEIKGTRANQVQVQNMERGNKQRGGGGWGGPGMRLSSAQEANQQRHAGRRCHFCFASLPVRSVQVCYILPFLLSIFFSLVWAHFVCGPVYALALERRGVKAKAYKWHKGEWEGKGE